MTLEQEAEIKFPMPSNPCKWVIARIQWKRKRWIEERNQKEKR